MMWWFEEAVQSSQCVQGSWNRVKLNDTWNNIMNAQIYTEKNNQITKWINEIFVDSEFQFWEFKKFFC